MHVLIVKTSSMGDVLHTLPALTDAAQVIPGIRFDWVVEEDFAQIPSWHPAVDKVLLVAIRRWWREYWFCGHEERVLFKRALQSRRYDVVIDAQGLIKSAALVTRLTKGIKHGQDSQSASESCASWWYDERHKISKKQHAIERTRELFSKSLGYSKLKTNGDYAIADRFLKNLPRDALSYFVFLHATTRENKHWPEENWRELISLVRRASKFRIKLLWYAEHEYQRAIRLAAGFDLVDVLPKLSLEAVAKQLSGAWAVVSIDTGLSHLTAALGRPNVTLYGPTDPNLIGAYGKNQYAVIPEKGKKIADISAQDVARVIYQIGA